MADLNVKRCLDWIDMGKRVKSEGGKQWASDRFTRKCSVGRFQFTYCYRNADSFMGRFGGGWNWKVGFQASSSTIIFSLLVADLRVTWAKVS